MSSKKDQSQFAGLAAISRFFSKVSVSFGQASFKVNSMMYWMEFGRRDSDIYIVTFPKSGTTLTQVILYQLCTNGKGKMDFHHIYDVSPWISNDIIKGHPVRYNLPSPRLIKSHDPYNRFEKNTKGRFICIYRNGMDVAVSLFHQNRNYNNQNLTFDASFKRFVSPKNKGSWFHYMHGWMRNKYKFPILYIRYEDLLKNKRREIERMIEFLKLEVSEEAIQKAVEYSSFEYMKEHEEKFGVQPPDFSKKVFDQFIRKGKSGEGEKTATPKQKQAFLKRQHDVLKNYEEMFNI